MIKSIKTTAMVMGLALSGLSFGTCTQDGKDGFLPENNMYIPVGMKSAKGGISEAQFNEVMDKVEALYAPIVAAAGGKLSVERNWTDGTVNAYATQSGKTWTVHMFGGLARHETITQDGMYLVICHELGHHLGGAPKIGGSSSSGGGWGGGSSAMNWASNEGQADTYATLKCLRKVWVHDDNASIARTLNAPQPLVDACNKVTNGHKEDASLCIRSGMAGKSVANLFSVLSHLPDTKFDTPDPAIVKKMDDAHPKAQCRLDTYFQGALCDVSMNEELSNTDENKGACTIANGHTIGNRPLCWFKPSK